MAPVFPCRFVNKWQILLRAPVSHCGSLEPATTHPLMAAHGEERAMRGDVLKPTSVANQNLKPKQINLNNGVNNSASNNKSKPPSSMNNFSIPGETKMGAPPKKLFFPPMQENPAGTIACDGCVSVYHFALSISNLVWWFVMMICSAYKNKIRPP